MFKQVLLYKCINSERIENIIFNLNFTIILRIFLSEVNEKNILNSIVYHAFNEDLLLFSNISNIFFRTNSKRLRVVFFVKYSTCTAV
jgi:hypothetical protein